MSAVVGRRRSRSYTAGKGMPIKRANQYSTTRNVPRTLGFSGQLSRGQVSGRGNSTTVWLRNAALMGPTSAGGEMSLMFNCSQVTGVGLNAYINIFERFEILAIQVKLSRSGNPNTIMSGGNIMCYVDQDATTVPPNVAAAAQYDTVINLNPALAPTYTYTRTVRIPARHRTLPNQLTPAMVWNTNNSNYGIGFIGDGLTPNAQMFYILVSYRIRFLNTV